MDFVKTADQEKALALLAEAARYVLLFGGSRSGKTFILIYALVKRALQTDGSRHAVLRLHSNTVKQAIWHDTFPKVMRTCFPGTAFTLNRTDWFAAFLNGSEIWFGGLDDGDRAEKILGKEFATIYFNESSEISYRSVNIALTRLAQKTRLVNKAYFDCNPPARSHWTFRMFVRKLDPETNLPLPRPDLYASLLMNPGGNAVNLAPGYIEEILSALPERQRRRFLDGQWSDDIDGALWKRAMISPYRTVRPPELRRIVIGVDPAVTSTPDSDDTGIVAAGLGCDGEYYVLNDATAVKASPAEWGRAVCAEYRRCHADRVIGEVNNGGDLIAMNLRNIDRNIAFRAVRASRGKITRAEPVAALYEQGRVHHVGAFPELEEEMCNYHPLLTAKSPDRLDALVWAITELSACAAAPRAIPA